MHLWKLVCERYDYYIFLTEKTVYLYICSHGNFNALHVSAMLPERRSLTCSPSHSAEQQQHVYLWTVIGKHFVQYFSRRLL